MKKLLLSLGTLASIVTPVVAVVVSCTTTTPKITPTDTPPKDTPPKGTPPTNVPPKETPVFTGNDFLKIGGKTNTVDYSDSAIKTNIIIDKDGHILTWKPFVPVKTTRSKSRFPSVTTPHPVTKLAEPFTRTTSAGAMDTFGAADHAFMNETEMSKAEIDLALASNKEPATTITPISSEDFQNLGKLLDGHLMIIDGYNDANKIEPNANPTLISDLLQKVGIGIRSLGISTVQATITREVHHIDVMGKNVNVLILKNVIFRLKGLSKYLQIDMSILIK